LPRNGADVLHRCLVRLRIELQLDVSSVVVSVTVSMPFGHLRGVALASFATFINYSS
jgi:ABC-type dipeptide/oligopeptide/nickel transport system permease subunit